VRAMAGTSNRILDYDRATALAIVGMIFVLDVLSRLLSTRRILSLLHPRKVLSDR